MFKHFIVTIKKCFFVSLLMTIHAYELFNSP